MRKLTEVEKQEIQFILNNYKASNFDIVISKGKKLLQKIPTFYEMNNIIGLSFHAKGFFEQAIKHYKDLVNQEPKHFGCLNNMGNSFHALNDLIKAKNCYEKCLEVNPKYINAIVNLGNLKKDANKYEEAIEYYLKALKINDKIFIIHYQLGLAYLALGKFENAKKFFYSTLEKNPKFTTADRMLSTFLDYKSDRSHIDSMEEKLKDESIDENLKIELYFALGKAYDDLSDFNKSFINYDEGNKSKEKIAKYNIEEDKKLFENIKSLFSEFNFENNEILDSNHKKIIFIVGMPRTGTSLIEQVLSSHKEIYGGGELRDLNLLISKNFFDSDNKMLEKINFKNSEILNELRDNYLNNLDRFETKKKYITDKDPLNFRWLGFIKIAFPNSKIINCVREDMDIGFSIWKNYFGPYMNFAYNFKDISNYYKLYKNLMNFWKKRIPNFIYDLNYENLILDKKKEIKNLLEYCELEWDENCLNSQKNTRAISTQSIVQARKPIYNTSLNAWKKYPEKILPSINMMKK